MADNRKYPKNLPGKQEILFSADRGKQNINYFFNRVVNQNNNIPLFKVDKNNIFKTINNDAVKFGGKRVLDRLKGDYFTIHLEGMMDSRYNLILKSILNTEIIS